VYYNKNYFYDFFKKYVSVKKVIIIEEYCDYHWQAYELEQKDEYEDDPGGYCLYWTYLYAELRLLNPLIDGDTIHTKLVNCLIFNNYTLKEYIRLYFTDIMLFMREFLLFCKKINVIYVKDINLDVSLQFLKWKYKL